MLIHNLNHNWNTWNNYSWCSTFFNTASRVDIKRRYYNNLVRWCSNRTYPSRNRCWSYKTPSSLWCSRIRKR